MSVFSVPRGADYADEERLLVTRLRSLFQYARDARRSRYETWNRNYRVVKNRLAIPSVSSWMPGPRASEVYPILSSLIAWSTDQAPNIDIIAAADPTSSMYPFVAQTAIDLTTVINSLWIADAFNAEVKKMLWDAAQFEMGILKVAWDNNAAGGLGNPQLVRVDPYSFYPDPKGSGYVDYKDSTFLCEAREMSYDEIELRYPDTAFLIDAAGGGEDVIDQRPDLGSDMGQQPKTGPTAFIPGSGTYGSLGAGAHNYLNRKVSRSDGGSYPGKRFKVYEFWLKENIEWYDGPVANASMSDRHYESQWRVVIICQGQVLFDAMAADLWPGGWQPYSRYVSDDLGEMYGIGLVEHLAHPSMYLNRLLNALQHNTELTGNPVLVEAENSGSGRVTITNRPGARIPIKGAAGMNNAPKWLSPPSMPPIAMQLGQFWLDSMERTSGLSDLQKGKAPNQRNAQGVINQVQEAAFVRVRSSLANLEVTLRDAAYKIADLIIDNYDEPRLVAVVGPEGQSTSLALAGHHFHVPTRKGATPLKYMLIVETGSTTATSQDARIAQSDKLGALGVVDDLYILQAHRVRNPQQVLQRLYAKRQAGLMGGGAGQRQRAARTGSQ